PQVKRREKRPAHIWASDFTSSHFVNPFPLSEPDPLSDKSYEGRSLFAHPAGRIFPRERSTTSTPHAERDPSGQPPAECRALHHAHRMHAGPFPPRRPRRNRSESWSGTTLYPCPAAKLAKVLARLVPTVASQT